MVIWIDKEKIGGIPQYNKGDHGLEKGQRETIQERQKK